MKRPIQAIAKAALALGFCAFALQPALAAYPEKTVKVIVGFAPGGTNDILARLIAQKLEDKLKQPFIVENKPGASSIIAAEYVAKSAADGYTLFVASSGALTVNPVLFKKISYDPVKDFDPVALLGSFPLVIVTGSDVPVSNVKEMIAMAKTTPDHKLNHGVASSSFQLAAELFARDANVKFEHISYRGTGPTINALLTGEIKFAFLDIGALMPHIKGGRIKPLAVTTATRSPALPNVPTIDQAGVPGYDVPIWTGLVLPKDAPKEVAATLKTALTEILKDKDFAKKLEAYGMQPGNADAAAFGKRIEGDLAKWRALAHTANIQAN